MTDTTLTIAMSGSSTNSSDTSSSSSNMNTNMSCTMPDFIFYDINGDTVNGTVVQLDNNSNDGLSSSLSSSICIFDKANCDPTNLPHECCSYNKQSINTSSHSSSGSWSKRYMILCVLFPIYYLKNSIQTKSKTKMTGNTKKTKKKGEQNKIKTSNDEDDDDDDDDEEILNDEGDDDEIVDTTTSQYPWFIRNLGRDKNNTTLTTTTGTVGCLVRYVVRMIWNVGFQAFMFLSIVGSIVLQNSYQAKMSVANRNLLMSAEAFMTPYQTIFTFIEDIVLVQIGYALGRKDKVKTNQLIHTGIAGSIVTGIIAGFICTLLGLWPNVFSALTNPGLKHDHELYNGCPSFDVLNKVTSISTIQKQRNIILPYWLLKSWSMIWQQIGMVVSGFFFGSKAIMEIGWIMTISLCLNLIIWFSFVGTTSSTMVNPLTLVGISDYVSDFTTPVLALLYLGTPLGYEICKRTGVTLSWTKLVSIFHFTTSSSTSISTSTSTSTSTKDTNDIINETTTLIKDSENGKVTVKDNGNFDDGMSTWNLLLDGLKVMFMDVAIQGCVSFTLYVALVQDSAVAYQISALQSALPSYGYSFAFGISMTFKLVGSQLLAEMKYEKFVKFATICTICVLLLIPGIMISVVQDRHEIALRYGSNACSYLKEKECSKFFIGIFGVHGDGVGDFTLQHTFAALAFGSIIDSISLVLRSILLSLLDFNFLVKATICAVVFAYVPAMYIATFFNAPFQGQAIAYYIAMNIPQLFLVVVFLVRLYNNFQRILNGGEGPWMEMVEFDDDDDDDDDNNVSTAAYEKEDVVSLTLDDHGSRRSSSSLKKRRSRNSSSSTSSVRRSSYKSQFRPLLLSHYRRSSSTSTG